MNEGRERPLLSGGEQARIELTAKYPALFAIGYAWFRPKVLLDGQLVPGAWGHNAYTVPPGQHHLDVYVPSTGPQMGRTSLVVEARPGRPTQLEYRAPWYGYMAGALGPPPQKAPGKVQGVALLIVVFVGIFLVISYYWL